MLRLKNRMNADGEAKPVRSATFLTSSPWAINFFACCNLASSIWSEAFAGIDAVKAGQIRRVEAGHAGKGSQGKVIVFHVVLNITVDPLDDGLGAVGFVFLALAAGFGAQSVKRCSISSWVAAPLRR